MSFEMKKQKHNFRIAGAKSMNIQGCRMLFFFLLYLQTLYHGYSF